MGAARECFIGLVKDRVAGCANGGTDAVHSQAGCHRLVYPPDSAIPIDDRDRIRDGIEGPFPIILRFPQFFLVSFPFADKRPFTQNRGYFLRHEREGFRTFNYIIDCTGLQCLNSDFLSTLTGHQKHREGSGLRRRDQDLQG